jgi:hypothetical protein
MAQTFTRVCSLHQPLQDVRTDYKVHIAKTKGKYSVFTSLKRVGEWRNNNSFLTMAPYVMSAQMDGPSSSSPRKHCHLEMVHMRPV